MPHLFGMSSDAQSGDPNVAWFARPPLRSIVTSD